MNYYDKFSFNQVFRSKTPCSFAYRADFRRFMCVSHRYWWGGAEAISNFPPNPGRTLPPLPISLWTAHLSRLWADSPTDLWAIQLTCREVTDFKKAVSQRVNKSSLLIRSQLTGFHACPAFCVIPISKIRILNVFFAKSKFSFPYDKAFCAKHEFSRNDIFLRERAKFFSLLFRGKLASKLQHNSSLVYELP